MNTRAHALALVGVVLLLTPWCVRATSELNLLPGWDSSPLIAWSPVVGLGPAGSIMCDAIACAGALLLLTAAALAGAVSCVQSHRTAWALLVATVVPTVAVAIHMTYARAGLTPPDAHARIGASWLSAALGALAIWRYCRASDRSARAVHLVVVATFIGVVAAIVLRGGQQVLIEHEALVASFRADPSRFLAAQGWTPGSSMAQAFERRLSQPDATGWFGLSNVLASFAACVAIIGLGLVWESGFPRPQTSLKQRGWTVGAAAALLIVGLAGLIFADSFGGLVALCVGCIAYTALLGYPLVKRSDRQKGMAAARFGLGAVLAPIVLVVLRRVFAERLDELSLLFRSFYVEASLSIFCDHPWLGVGPGGFQAAYAVAKNPLSPEEVVSPHSIGFDWLATLGIAGMLWFGLLMAMAALIARRGLCDHKSPVPTLIEAADRSTLRVLLLIPALSTLTSVWLSSGLLTPDAALIRISGLALWIGLALLVYRASRGDRLVLTTPLAAGALALIAHAQVEVTMSWPASVGLCAAVLACAASGGTIATAPRTIDAADGSGLASRFGPSWSVSSIAATLLIGLLLALVAARVWAWERPLRDAAVIVSPIGTFAQRLADPEMPGRADSTHADSLERICEDLRAELGRVGAPVPASAELLSSRAAWERAISDLDRALIPAAISRMMHGVPADQLHPVWQVRREISSLWVRLAESARLRGDAVEERRCLEAAGEALLPTADHLNSEPSTDFRPAALWHAHAMVLVRSADRAADAREREELLTRARASFDAAARLDPHNPTIALGLMRLEVVRADSAAAQAAARRVLEIDRQMRFDVTRRLSPADRAEAEQLAARAP